MSLLDHLRRVGAETRRTHSPKQPIRKGAALKQCALISTDRFWAANSVDQAGGPISCIGVILERV
jgi:purine nucleoside permease